MTYPRTVQEFSDDRGLRIVDDAFPFLALVHKETAYWDTDIGLSVCYDDGDVFVMNGIEEDLSRLDDTFVADFVTDRINELLDRIDLDEWSSAQEINSRNSLSSPYSEALVLEFDTKGGVREDLSRAAEFVESVVHSEFIEALYSTIGFSPMEYESEPYNTPVPNKRRVGSIEEWTPDFIRISVFDIEDTRGDMNLRTLQTVGRILIYGEDVPFVEDVAEDLIRLVEPSQSEIVGEDVDERYRVGVILSEEWQS